LGKPSIADVTLKISVKIGKVLTRDPDASDRI
jgi:hypothetical protein